MEAVKAFRIANTQGLLEHASDPTCYLAEVNYEKLLRRMLHYDSLITAEEGYYDTQTREYIAQFTNARVGWEENRQWLDDISQQQTAVRRILVKSPNGMTTAGTTNALVQIEGEFFLARSRSYTDAQDVDFIITRPIRAEAPRGTQYHQIIPGLYRDITQATTLTTHTWQHRRRTIPQGVFKGNSAISS